ncbi:MAG: hypothetical protein Q3978_01175 [Limosilactobacillus gorillae]|nr:hypothetical protein [Limosilactobacillus gorillae]
MILNYQVVGIGVVAGLAMTAGSVTTTKAPAKHFKAATAAVTLTTPGSTSMPPAGSRVNRVTTTQPSYQEATTSTSVTGSVLVAPSTSQASAVSESKQAGLATSGSTAVSRATTVESKSGDGTGPESASATSGTSETSAEASSAVFQASSAATSNISTFAGSVSSAASGEGTAAQSNSAASINSETTENKKEISSSTSAVSTSSPTRGSSESQESSSTPEEPKKAVTSAKQGRPVSDDVVDQVLASILSQPDGTSKPAKVTTATNQKRRGKGVAHSTKQSQLPKTGNRSGWELILTGIALSYLLLTIHHRVWRTKQF